MSQTSIPSKAAAGPRLLFLHAYPLNSGMWDPVVALLPSWSCEAIDFAGFAGTSVPDAAPSIAPLADQTIAHLDETGPAVLVGLSLGGYVMGEVARQRPDLLLGLVFCDTRLTADTPEERARRLTTAANIAADGVDVLIRDYLPGCLGATTREGRPDVVAVAADLVRASSPAGLAWAMRAMAARADTMDAVRAAGVPGHVIVGAEDALCTATDRRNLQQAVDGGITVIPEAGHYSALECPAAFAEALRAAVAPWTAYRV